MTDDSLSIYYSKYDRSGPEIVMCYSFVTLTQVSYIEEVANRKHYLSNGN